MTDVVQKSSPLQKVEEIDRHLREVAFKLMGRSIRAEWSEPYEEWPDHPEHMRRTMGRMYVSVRALAAAAENPSLKGEFLETLSILEIDLDNLKGKVFGNSGSTCLPELRQSVGRMRQLIETLRAEMW